MAVDAQWPTAATDDEFDALLADDATMRPAVIALGRSLGLDVAAVERFPDGSLPVYALGGLVLKLFPPACADDFRIEAGVLAAVAGRLPVPTPGVHATGSQQGWGYVVMERLRGRPLLEVWPSATPAQRDSIASQLGEMITALHETPPPEISNWFPADWESFVAEQKAGCVGRQAERGLAPQWLDQIPDFLAATPLGQDRVLLHTEIYGEHLYVDEDWRLSGLFDFEPAMRGARGYDYVAPGIFLGGGDKRFLRRLGSTAEPRQMLAWTLLHRYSALARYMERMPTPAEPTLDALADRWFGV